MVAILEIVTPYVNFLILVVALISGLVSLRNRTAIKKIHLEINSRMTQLIEMTSKEGFGRGKLEQYEGPPKDP